MTNLMRWLLYGSLFLVPYSVTLYRATQISSKLLFEIQILPLLLIIAFGIYAAFTVLYRTFTFNDCPEAAKELQQQIEMAKKDLLSKGFKFRD